MTWEGMIHRWSENSVRWLSSPVSAYSLIAFRVAFGLMLAFWVVDYLRTDRVRLLCAPDVFHFTYQGFSWVRPWPGNGMVIEFVAILLAAILMAAGAVYRAAALVFAFGFTHFFLIDRTNYQNHYYLILLLSWLMVLLPVNRLAALDVLNGSVTRSETVPRWCLLLLQFHIGLPYFFGGIAKIEGDWLSGDPMRNMLMTQSWAIIANSWFDPQLVSSALTWGGLLFDLLIVPAVLWQRTRMAAFLLAIVFHVCNSFLFSIHVFPWLMIAATTVFFAADWPRRLLPKQSSGPFDSVPGGNAIVESVSIRSGLVLSALLLYCGFHVLWPLRHLMYEGNTGWTERGHYFSWRMMLRGKTVGIRYYLTNPETGETLQADIRDFLNPEQQIKFVKDPEMILDLAHGLADEYRRRTEKSMEVRALVLASLNGRKPQLLIDPAVNLAAEPKGWRRRRWIMPLTEPRRTDPWTVPLNEWEHHVDLPDLPFLTTCVQNTTSRL